MVSAEVQRTLVKSPPELWSELSDPAALARHLGEVGEIRITRADPEKTLEWEAEQASGTVAIKPSGWGTRVTLTLRRQGEAPPGEEQDAAIQEQDAAIEERESEYTADAEPVVGEVQAALALEVREPPEAQAALALEVREPPQAPSEPRAEPEPSVALDAEQAPDEHDASGPQDDADDHGGAIATSAPTPTLSWWRRLFRRRAQPAGLELAGEADRSSPEDVDEPAVAVQLPEPATAAAQAAQHPDGRGEQRATPSLLAETPSAAEQRAAEQRATEQADADAGEPDATELAAVEQATALLSSVLDRLGAAHHRPFSRP
jgi:hypothetical protein